MTQQPDLLKLQQVLDAQYDVTVSFCNAQTSLWNATRSGASLHHTLGEYNACLHRVQGNWERLQQMQEIMQTTPDYRRIWTVYKAHVERTKRVLQTVQRAGGGVWSSQGVPLGTNDSDTVTVGLATLRASIDSVREVLVLYLKE